MAKLTDLGFSEGIIFETIVSSYCKDGSPNAAPMGACKENESILTLDIFNSSLTNHNILKNKSAVINLTSRIDLFYNTAFKEVNPQGKLPEEWFEKAITVNAPKLCLADAAIEVSVESIEQAGKEKTRFHCKVVNIEAAKIYPQVYCRAMSATLEAIVYATRVKAFANKEDQKKQVTKLLNLIENCHDVVIRTAPISPYSRVMTDLNRMIDSWRVMT